MSMPFLFTCNNNGQPREYPPVREEQRFVLDGLDLAGSDRNIASHAPRSTKVDVSADLMRGRGSLEGCANWLGRPIWNMTEVPLRLVVGRV